MLAMNYATKVSQPAAEIDALCQEIGEAEARGRKVPALRKRLAGLLTSWEELEAEAKIQAAADAHARTVETEHELGEWVERREARRARWAELGPRYHEAKRVLAELWAEHEAIFKEDEVDNRVRDLLVNRNRAHSMGLDEPDRLDFAELMDTPGDDLHPTRLLALNFQRYGGRRPEIRESNHPGRRVFTPSGNASPPSALDTRQRSALERFLGK